MRRKLQKSKRRGEKRGNQKKKNVLTVDVKLQNEKIIKKWEENQKRKDDQRNKTKLHDVWEGKEKQMGEDEEKIMKRTLREKGKREIQQKRAVMTNKIKKKREKQRRHAECIIQTTQWNRLKMVKKYEEKGYKLRGRKLELMRKKEQY